VNAALSRRSEGCVPQASLSARLHSRVVLASPPPGLRIESYQEAVERVARTGRRLRAPVAKYPRPVTGLPTDAHQLERVSPDLMLPRCLAESVLLPTGGLPPSSNPAECTELSLAAVSETARGQGVGVAPALVSVVGDRSEDHGHHAPFGKVPPVPEQLAARLETGEAALTESASMLTVDDDPRNGHVILSSLGTLAARTGKFDEAVRRFRGAAEEARALDAGSCALHTCSAAIAAAEHQFQLQVAAKMRGAVTARAHEADMARRRAVWRVTAAARRDNELGADIASRSNLVVKVSVEGQST
jgi:hypothetical protein